MQLNIILNTPTITLVLTIFFTYKQLSGKIFFLLCLYFLFQSVIMAKLYILTIFLVLLMTLITHSQEGKSIVMFVLYVWSLIERYYCVLLQRSNQTYFTYNQIVLWDIRKL